MKTNTLARACFLIPSLFLLLQLPAAPAAAQGPPCNPCAGLRFQDAAQLDSSFIDALKAAPALRDEARLYVNWPVVLDGSAQVAATAEALRGAGAVPWLSLVFHSPAPLLEHAGRLDAELKEVARLAREAGDKTHFQILWQPEAGTPADFAREYAFLFKRASVTITGARGDSRVITQPLDPDPAVLNAFYGEEIAAYVDGVALKPAPEQVIKAAVARLAELDPGRPVVLDAVNMPGDRRQVLPAAARSSAAGINLTFINASSDANPPNLSAADVAPFKVLANEFQGDVSLDPYSRPEGGQEAWSFVRGKDLSLRVIVTTPPASDEVTLKFPDANLKRPSQYDLESGESRDLFGQRRTDTGLDLEVSDPGPVALLRLERMTAEEIEGLEGLKTEITVTDERQMPVEEILRRLQAFEDDQARRLQSYVAQNTTHMRFQFGTAVASLEATFEGPFFFRRGHGFDWAWQTFYVNGVKWRGDTIPELPLVQPEKAAALPLEISFTKEYNYRLRGTEVIEGRDCWVVEFEPAAAVAPGNTLYQGVVWVDREFFGRVRTRALQLGLEGEVSSNEETVYNTPVDTAGQPAPWSPDSLWMPLRVTSQQLLNVLNATTVVETETLLTSLQINPQDFETQRQAVLDSDVTMVRDTDKGLRYLTKDEETGERVVQEGYRKDRLFGVGGVFYDKAQDFPLPLAGVNYFSFDYHNTGAQVNLFFAGALLIGNIADPDFLGSKWDAGANVFALALAGNDTPFVGDQEVKEEEVKSRPARISLFLGHPLGEFGKLDLTYSLERTDYSRADKTADDFVLPQDHFTHTFLVETRYNRAGYRLLAQGSFNKRSDWQPWGLPGSPELDAFDPNTEDYTKWGASLAKTWWFPEFRKFSASLEYLDGQDLDRFSKYQFGYFSDTRIRGYQSDKIRAETAYAAHLSYGVDLGEVFRIELLADGALATDQATGLDNEFLGGVGIAGTFIGPWDTIINLDLGKAVAGPDDGYSVFLSILKLFN